MWNRPSLGGVLNAYQDIDDYMHFRADLEVGSDRFFLSYNAEGKSLKTFFKKQHVGHNCTQ